MILATIAVQHPSDPSVRMLINESDLTDAHVLWDDGDVRRSDDSAVRIGKGPRGKWYVLDGRERVAGPFEVEAEAEAAKAAMV